MAEGINDMRRTEEKTRPRKWTDRPGVAIMVGLAIGSIIIFPELRARLWTALPYLILLLCPLMHVFMHRGHHGNVSSGPEAPPVDGEDLPAERTREVEND